MPCPIKAAREKEPGAPLAKAFLMARSALSNPFGEAREALGEPGWAGAFGERSAPLAREAINLSQGFGPMAKEAFRLAFGGESVCFALAPKVEVYLFEAGAVTICAKEEGIIFEWGWAADGDPAGLSRRSEAGERALLAEGLARIGCALALACQGPGWQELEDVKNKSERARQALDSLSRWGAGAVELSRLFAAREEREELGAALPEAGRAAARPRM